MTTPVDLDEIRSIRFVEMGFDTIRDAGTHFTLYKNKKLIGTVLKDHLNPRTLSKLTSLCE